MIVQAVSFGWDKKLKRGVTQQERNSIMLKSGKERARLMMNFETKEEYYRPCIGKFIIHGLVNGDDFKFKESIEAINKSKEMISIIEKSIKKSI
ncbi:hypothetical protein ACVWYN_002708 [Pedobacter sp. UYP24]